MATVHPPSALVPTRTAKKGRSATPPTERVVDAGLVTVTTEQSTPDSNVATPRSGSQPTKAVDSRVRGPSDVSPDTSSRLPDTEYRSVEIQTNTLYATTTRRGRSLLCTKGHDSCKPSKFVMFQVSGAIGMILFYLSWSDLFYRLKGYPHGPIISWTFAYSCSILWQHLLNRTLVWTDLQQGYWESLGGMCMVYLFSLVLSSILNVLFVEVLSIAANFAFFVTAVFTGAVNYVIIAKCALGENDPEDCDKHDKKEDKDWEDRDIVVNLASNMVSGIQLPTIGDHIAVESWGKKIQQVTKAHAKHWSNDHQV